MKSYIYEYVKYDHKGHIRPHLWNLSGLIYLKISNLITTLKYVFLWTTLVLIYLISNVLSYVLSTRIKILHYFNADLTLFCCCKELVYFNKH